MYLQENIGLVILSGTQSTSPGQLCANDGMRTDSGSTIMCSFVILFHMVPDSTEKQVDVTIE
jgi:hypothetical protein